MRRTCRLMVVMAAALGPCATAGAAGPNGAFEIPLSVKEGVGTQRKSAPISGGLPLPKGRFRSDQPFALFREDGREMPCQVRPLVVETDGTLRWILLDFQDDVEPRRIHRYVLRAKQPTVRPKGTLRVDETADAVTLDTGRIRLAVSKTKPFGLFDSVAAGGRTVVTGGAATYTQLHGRSGWDDASPWKLLPLRAGPPESVKLWYAGPLRATVEVAGRFAGDPLQATYKAWITTWANQSQLWVKYKLCNANPDRRCAVPIYRAALTLDLAGGAGKVLLGASRELTADGQGWIHRGLGPRAGAGSVQAGGAGGEVLWRSRDSEDTPGGWIAHQGATTVSACDRLFATAVPRRLAVVAGPQGLAGPGRQLVLEPIARPFPPVEDSRGHLLGAPWGSEGFWLYDCSHHSSEYLFDFDALADGKAPNPTARAARNRLWALAPGEYYSACQAVGTGRFGTLADEIACYRKWGWSFKQSQVPDRAEADGDAFVPHEDNHYESEADSVEALLLMYLRTGQRGWFDLGEAWARYHMDLQIWRTDGWRWKDGAIWFPQGGPQGTRRVREPWNFAWGANWGDRKDSPDCADLWVRSIAKSCYCHYYGSGVVDYYCLTGDRDALDAAIDNVETKDNEFRTHCQFQPGKTPVGSIRGFGRGFQVVLRTLAAEPDNQFLANLAHLCARTLWQSPLLDERGFHCTGEGAQQGLSLKGLSPEALQWMRDRGVTFTARNERVDTLSQGGQTWKTRNYGGTWMHVYVQNGADLYARHFDDDDMRDFTIAFAQMSAKYMRSRKCHQTWYYTYFDLPAFGEVFDPWIFDHADTTDGVGCVHSGHYTRHYPDACARGYGWTGEKRLLEEAKLFWYYGSKRGYNTKAYTGGANEVGLFAGHRPPKEDQVLAVSRLFDEAAHPRADDQPPAAVTDLRVRLLGGGKAEVRFAAPADAGGGKVVRYQVKADALPIVPYEQWDAAKDPGRRRNWWRATNCQGEPAPAAPGTAERFTVTGLPEGAGVYFAVRSFDDSSNRSAVSNLARP